MTIHELRDHEHRMVSVGEVTLHSVLAGPRDGPLVVLLHGFPELWYGWHRQIRPLADAGYRVVAPDQRGYAASDKPQGVRAYTRRILARDVVGLIEALGRERAIVVGHDWGGAVAWWLALQHPEVVESFVPVNIPHPIVFAKALRHLPQARRSWYIAMFQLPLWPEHFLSKNNFQVLADLMRRATRPGALTEEDLDLYRASWRRPRAITSMLAWYRAAARFRPEPLRTRRPGMPTLLIWGKGDPALGHEMAAPSIDYCERGTLATVERAGHFVQHDAPDEVSDLLLRFLGRPEEHAGARAG